MLELGGGGYTKSVWPQEVVKQIWLSDKRKNGASAEVSTRRKWSWLAHLREEERYLGFSPFLVARKFPRE